MDKWIFKNIVFQISDKKVFLVCSVNVNVGEVYWKNTFIAETSICSMKEKQITDSKTRSY